LQANLDELKSWNKFNESCDFLLTVLKQASLKQAQAEDPQHSLDYTTDPDRQLRLGL